MNEIRKTKRSDDVVFQYVSGEMSASEESQFEGQLEHDQHLREQVASMVCTLAAVDQVFAESAIAPAVKKPSVKQSVLRIVTSLAAMLLLATLAISMIGSQKDNNAETESIAIAWAESVSLEEFELLDQMEELDFVSLDFESDDDWIYEVVDATYDDYSNLN